MDSLDTVRSQGFYSKFKEELLGNSKQGTGEGIGNHFSILTWKFSWTKEPGGLEFTELQSRKQLSMHACKQGDKNNASYSL